MKTQTLNNFPEIARKIKAAEALIFTAGAGMGVDSGLPDFRGNQGFWKAYPALKGHSFSDMANPNWFETDPHRAWGFYGHRLNLYRQTTPHEGFNIMLKWSQHRPYFVLTSNVDGAFQKAGFNRQAILECHGSIHHLQSLSGEGEVISAAPYTLQIDEEAVLAADPLPHNAQGALLRPNILMFGDWAWDEDRSYEQQLRFEDFLSGVSLAKTVIIEVGAGTAVPTIRWRGESLASAGATLVRINPREWKKAEFGVSMGGLEGLKEIDKLIM